MARLPHSIRTIFADLVQKVETAPPAGSVFIRPRDGIDHLYAKVRVGSDRLNKFIGRRGDTEAEALADTFRRGAALAADRRRTITLLKRAGLAAPEQTMGATLDAVAQAGLFQQGAVVVGTAAYLMSEALVGSTLPGRSLMTEDLDFATPDLTISAEPPEAFESILKRADPSFSAILQLDPRRPAGRFSTANGFVVDLVTPTRRRTDENPMPLKKLAAGAAPLQHLDWLISDPVPTIALWGAGVQVVVPQPARYAVHKLIVAQKRDPANRPKRQKDLLQAAALLAALELDDPFALEDALADARRRGKKGWSDPIDRSLEEIERLGL